MSAHHLLLTLRATSVRSATRALTLMALLTCSACTWGVQASDIPWSRGPDGAPATVELQHGGMRMTGQLLAVDTAAVLLHTTIISRIPWVAVRSLRIRGLGNEYRVWGGAQPANLTIQRLMLVSRFPQGVEPAVLMKLLADTNQQAVEEIR